MTQPSMSFIQTMRETRKSRSMTQEDLAVLASHHLGRTIDAITITRIEKGKRALQLDEAASIAKALNMTLQGMLPVELSVEDEIAELERDRAVAYADLTRLDLKRQEIETSLAGIISRQQELQDQLTNAAASTLGS